ncbi:MAG: PmoA family protein [Planctomycetota bacterium]|nr:PmoA family protein [Planctomycetota bacterium]
MRKFRESVLPRCLGNALETTAAAASLPLTPILSPGYRGEGVMARPGVGLRLARARVPRLILLLAGICLCSPSLACAADPPGAFAFVPDAHGLVLKTPQGQTLFGYMNKKPQDTKLTANSVCCLFPVKTPAGEDVVEFAPVDHPHHRGVFLTWHAMQGQKAADFWGWGQFAPTKDRVIVNRSLKAVAADAQHAVLEARNDWVAEDVTLIAETTTITARQTQGLNVIDFDFRLLPQSDITLQQTAFSGFCVKSRKDGKAVYTSPEGEVKLLAPHHLKPETDWPAAAWYDYTIALDSGKTLGATVVDHPGNPPSPWHNLQAIAMINPCIVAPGPVTLKAGQPLRLRYRLLTHDGPLPLELVKQLSDEFRRS